MKIPHRILLFSILLLGACSAEQAIVEEPSPPPPPAPVPVPKYFEEELTGIMSDLRSVQLMCRYSLVQNTTDPEDEINPNPEETPEYFTDNPYTEETREYLFFDMRKTVFNSANLTKAHGTKEGSSKTFDNEFIKKHRTEGELKKINNPKIYIKDTTTGEHVLVNQPREYMLYGWNFTHINRWYHNFQIWNDELDLIVGGKLPFFVKIDGDNLTIKRVKYIIHSPDVSLPPEVVYIINEPFNDPLEISYEKNYL